MLRSLVIALALAAPAFPQTVVSGGGSALQSAIAAASPGDTLIVRAGIYDELRMSIGITIVCDPGVEIHRFDAAVVNIENLPAGQTFALRGALIVPSHPLTNSGWVNACDGIVIFEAIPNASTFTVQDCAQVSFHDCECSITNLRSIVTAVDSDATISGNGHTTISGGTIPLLFATQTETIVTGNAVLNLVQVNGGTLRIDPDVQLGTHTLADGAVLITEEIPSLSIQPLTPGTSAAMSTTIGAGQFGALAIGFPSPVVPTLFGNYWGGGFMLTLVSGFAPANGVLSTSFAVPAGWLAGEKFVLHGVLAEVSGAVRLSPALVTVVP